MDKLLPLQLQRPLMKFIHSRPTTAALLSLPLAAILSIPFRAAYFNYLSWMHLGGGGLPYDVRGWLIQWMMWPLANFDMTSIHPYADGRHLRIYGDSTTKRYLKQPLPFREPRGHRPLVGKWGAPQRQQSELLPEDEKVREGQRDLLESIVSSDKKHMRIATSGLERRGPAIWLAEDLKVPRWAKSTKGEIAHIHSNLDWSAHVSLAPADAMEVVEKGWGQRHAWSHMLHIGYTFLYTPRNAEELAVVRRIMEAGCEAMVDAAKGA